MDDLLEELASLSPFSHRSVRDHHSSSPKRDRRSIIQDLYTNMIPKDAAYLTQIILKDLSPLLYPLSAESSAHYTAALKQGKSNEVHVLSRWEALRAYDTDGFMTRAWGVRGLQGAAEAYENHEYVCGPMMGYQLQVSAYMLWLGAFDLIRSRFQSHRKVYRACTHWVYSKMRRRVYGLKPSMMESVVKFMLRYWKTNAVISRSSVKVEETRRMIDMGFMKSSGTR